MAKRDRPKKKNKLEKILNIRFSEDIYVLIQKYAVLNNLEDSSFIRLLVSEYLINMEKIINSKTKHDCMTYYHAFIRNIMMKIEDILRLRDSCQNDPHGDKFLK